MSRKKRAWANKEVETFVCILGEEDVVYDVYVAAAAIDIRPTTKGIWYRFGYRNGAVTRMVPDRWKCATREISNMGYGNIMSVETSGASNVTARAYGKGLTKGGVPASEKMASDDLERMKSYKTIIGNVADKYDVDRALIAAIISRESQAGKSISGKAGWGDNGKGFGLMQVDKRWHQPRGAWNSEAHLDQATKILVDFVPVVQKKFPGWSPEKHLKGAIAAYNMGERVLSYSIVDHVTTGQDYSSDVVARAQFYKGKLERDLCDDLCSIS
ncbi:unnamed protein product [Boreogadus saida]